MTCLYEYAWASGFDVALGSLRNVQTDLYPYSNRLIAPKTNPVDIFPVRRKALNRRVYGDGDPIHLWNFRVLPIAALDYIIDTYISNGTVASAPVTIYTRRADRGIYQLYNAYLDLPQPGIDYTYDRGAAFDLVLKLNIVT